MHPDDRSRVAQIVEQRLAGSDSGEVLRYRILLDSGEVHSLEEMTTLERREDGSIAAIVGTLHDISFQVAATQQAIQVEKDRALKTFIAGVTHDLNNHLQGITGSLSLLRISPPSQQSRWLDVADESATAAADVVAHIRMLAGSDPQPTSTVAMDHLVRRAARMVDMTGADATFTLEAVEVIGEAADLAAAVAAVIENGIDALCQKHDDEFVPQLRVTLQSAGDVASLVIDDNGIGMDEETLASAFNAYFTTKRGQHLAGLGLAIAREVVHRHRGSILVESHPGAGTRVTLTLPVKAASDAAVEDTPATPAIVIVDDDPAVRLVAATQIEDAGYRVLEVDAADQLEPALASVGPALLVLGQPYPALLRRVRTLKAEVPGLRLLLLDDGNAGAAAELADAVVAKPWPGGALIQAVEDLLASD